MTTPTVASVLRAQHDELDSLLRLQLETVIALDFATAASLFRLFGERLDLHLKCEERWLLPRIREAQGARWDAGVYEAEHAKLHQLGAAYADKLAVAAGAVPTSASARRRLALSLIDAAHAFRHVLEHHEQRETEALLHEVPESPRAARGCARAMARLARRQGDMVRTLYARHA